MALMTKIKLLILSVVLIILGVVFYNFTLVGSEDVANEGISADSDFPVVIRIEGGMLEVASVTGKRTFTKAADPILFGQNFPLCRERASWSVPYKITYRVELGEKWAIKFSNGTLVASVPELAPSIPVAVDMGQLSKGPEESCWFVPNLGTRDKALMAISDELKVVAESKQTKNFAREDARKTVIEFLRTWAMNNEEYPTVPADAPIKVFFPGE